jgi:hypothetical protein
VVLLREKKEAAEIKQKEDKARMQEHNKRLKDAKSRVPLREKVKGQEDSGDPLENAVLHTPFDKEGSAIFKDADPFKNKSNVARTPHRRSGSGFDSEWWADSADEVDEFSIMLGCVIFGLI